VFQILGLLKHLVPTLKVLNMWMDMQHAWKLNWRLDEHRPRGGMCNIILTVKQICSVPGLMRSAGLGTFITGTVMLVRA
jgi:hypothetical protein